MSKKGRSSATSCTEKKVHEGGGKNWVFVNPYSALSEEGDLVKNIF